MHLPPARFDRNLSMQGRQCCGYKEGKKAEEEKEGREYTAPVANRRITEPGVRGFCGLPQSAEITGRNCFTKFTKWQADILRQETQHT
jgi:hypothetical protein